jgi:tetratricopeptide (TPR) repeat protein
MTVAAPQTAGLAALLAARSVAGASGIATAQRGRLRRLFCLDKGWLVLAASNLVEEQLAEYLIRRSLLTPGQKIAFAEEARRRKTKLVPILLEREVLSMARLRVAAEAMIVDLVSSTLEWPDGETTFSAGRPSLEGEVPVRLAVLPLLLAHFRRHPDSVDALRARLGPPDTRPVALPEAPALLAAAPPDLPTRAVLDLCDGTRSIGQMLDGTPHDDEAVLRTLYGLTLIGVLGRAAPLTSERREPELHRDECLGRFSVPRDADHYSVLGLDRSASGAAIRDAYYSVARRYHPDRFRSGPLADLLGEAEVYFSRVTEAHNTLSKPGLRAEYDEGLTASPGESRDPRSDTAYLARQNFLKGRALVERKHYGEAVTFLENAAQLDPGVADYHLEVGQLLARNPRRKEEAERHLLQAAELAPASFAAYLALGHLYLRAGRQVPAAMMFREVLRWEPSHPEATDLIAGLGPVEEGAGPLPPQFGT